MEEEEEEDDVLLAVSPAGSCHRTDCGRRRVQVPSGARLWRQLSCHNVITGKWTPSSEDEAVGRLPGFGMTTLIINGNLECGKGTTTPQEQRRKGFFDRYCTDLGIDQGSNLDCANMQPY
ncbi:hypothetical protein CBR_g3888 [Chara braunii]|uniref:Glycoside hydrolase family 19 catalytic domain-containing protein n=1 Tax=Chara braunii TaxID=69332 RepID=A0A388KGM3_CHABU|nr:hypothetical protein CBR_g3888 [Chara braunii]|eukprot:GBG69189.1 hypothetical protein CBR_g3888 [Chara braunii]